MFEFFYKIHPDRQQEKDTKLLVQIGRLLYKHKKKQKEKGTIIPLLLRKISKIDHVEYFFRDSTSHRKYKQELEKHIQQFYNLEDDNTKSRSSRLMKEQMLLKNIVTCIRKAIPLLPVRSTDLQLEIDIRKILNKTRKTFLTEEESKDEFDWSTLGVVIVRLVEMHDQKLYPLFEIEKQELEKQEKAEEQRILFSSSPSLASLMREDPRRISPQRKTSSSSSSTSSNIENIVRRKKRERENTIKDMMIQYVLNDDQNENSRSRVTVESIIQKIRQPISFTFRQKLFSWAPKTFR